MATNKELMELSIGKIFYNCKAQALANDHFMFLGALCNINKIMQLSELFCIAQSLANDHFMFLGTLYFTEVMQLWDLFFIVPTFEDQYA